MTETTRALGRLLSSNYLLIVPLIACSLYLVILSVRPADAVKCWVCNSRSDMGCGDPFDNESFPITDCDSELGKRKNLKFDNGEPIPATMCRKIVQKVSGQWRFVRSCAFLGEPGVGGDERFCSRRTGLHDIYIEDCLCRGKDGCNDSYRLSENQAFVWLLCLGVFSTSWIFHRSLRSS